MRSSSRDAIFVFINLVIFCCFGWMLYADFSQRIEKTDGVRLGTITFKKRVAERKYSDQVIWETITENSVLYDNDSLRTADGSEATVLLDDGTRIELGEETLILLARSGRGLSIDFRQGTIAAKAGAPPKLPGSSEAGGGEAGFDAGSATNIEIRSGKTAVALGKADATLNRKKGATDLVVDVTRGRAVVAQDGKRVEVRENEQAVIDARQSTPTVRKAGLVPTAGSGVVTTQTKTASVGLAWEGDAVGPYTLALAREASVTSPLITQRVDVKVAQVALGPGIWYWRVAGQDGAPSRIERVSVVRIVLPQPVQPANGTTLTYHAAQPLVRFVWVADESAAGYDVEIARDPGFSALVTTLQSRTGGIATDGLAAGEYWWRVSARYPAARGSSVQGGVSRFVIKKREAPPVVALPAPATSVSTVQLASRQAAISWQGDPEFSRYRVEVARTAEFAQVVHREETTMNFSRIKPDIAEGRYFWRVTGIDQQGKAGATSPTGSIEVRKPRPAVLMTPAEDAMLAGETGGTPVLFSWQDPNNGGQARIDVAGNQGFTKIAQSRNLGGNSARLVLPVGVWWWRVTLLDAAGKGITTPSTRRISISQALALPGLREPKPGAEIDMSRSNAIEFSWGSVEGAEAYEFALYSYQGSVLQKVFETRVPGTEYLFGMLDRLDRGGFVWEITALALDGVRVKSRSKPARGNFVVRLPDLRKPVIVTPGVMYAD
ncbi:MAG TPA: FecR domain-containing protein [Spirochaetota bacterium]|nr:FecR domain-containing protein [Spirochaetota bacterium]